MCTKRPVAWRQSSPIQSRLLYRDIQAAIRHVGHVHKEASDIGAVVADTVAAAVLLHAGSQRTGQRDMCMKTSAASEQSSPIRSRLM